MISCIMPPCRFYAHSCSLVVLHNNDKILLGQKYYKNILYLTAVFNSMTFDYLIRIKTNINLSFFIIKGVAIPDDIHSEIVQNIIKISGMLSMQDENFNVQSPYVATSFSFFNIWYNVHLCKYKTKWINFNQTIICLSGNLFEQLSPVFCTNHHNNQNHNPLYCMNMWQKSTNLKMNFRSLGIFRPSTVEVEAKDSQTPVVKN